MKVLFLEIVLGLGLFATGTTAYQASRITGRLVVLETESGNIVIEMLPKTAPKHVQNFEELIAEGFYDGTLFHRIVAKSRTQRMAIQGGDPNTIHGDPETWGFGQPWQKTVPAEFSMTLKHVRGTVSMARKELDEDSATSQFFICREAEPQWDGKYSIFGTVVKGMEVVDAIAAAPVVERTERPVDPVRIKHARLVNRIEAK
jgi:peptidyl-prolyl cis-trans isomerase B (cyclophilin B)